MKVRCSGDFQDILFRRSQPVSLFHEYIKPLFVEALSDSEDFPNVRSSHVLFIIPLVLHTPSSPLIHFCNSLNPAINIVFSFFINLFPFFNRVASKYKSSSNLATTSLWVPHASVNVVLSHLVKTDCR